MSVNSNYYLYGGVFAYVHVRYQMWHWEAWNFNGIVTDTHTELQHLTLWSCWWLRQEATSRDPDSAHPLNQIGHVSCALLSPCRLRGLLFWLILCFLDLFGFLLQLLRTHTTHTSSGEHFSFTQSLRQHTLVSLLSKDDSKYKMSNNIFLVWFQFLIPFQIYTYTECTPHTPYTICFPIPMTFLTWSIRVGSM